MLIYSALFYIFSALLVTSAIGVVAVKNAVYSVLLLIFSFFNGAAIFLLLGAEFLAMSLVIVYVGAVAVLFLFVVMTINFNTQNIKEQIAKHYVPLIFVGLLFLGELIAAIYLSISPLHVAESQSPLIFEGVKTRHAAKVASDSKMQEASERRTAVYSDIHEDSSTEASQQIASEVEFRSVSTNTHQIGLVLYTKYAYLFQLCGIILLVAIISAIILTHREPRNFKKQVVSRQLDRTKDNSIKLVSVKRGEGTGTHGH